jgi:hypothetical protein
MEGAMARKPGISDAGIIMLVGAAAAAFVSGCTVAVDDRHETVRSGRAQTAVSVFNPDRPESPPDLPVYPGAKAVTPPPPPFNVSFSGRFAATSAYSSHFATDDGVGLVLQFYRDAMRNYSERFECRGTVNVRARGGTEELRCIPHGGSDSVQLAVSVPGHHAVVRVAPAVTGSTFTLVNVRTRH